MREHFDDNLEYNDDEMLEESEMLSEEGAELEEDIDQADNDEAEEDADTELGIEIIDLYGRDRIVKRVGKERQAKPAESEEKTGKIDPVREFFSFLLSFLFAVAIALLIQRFVIINANIPSGSMENTIMTGDRLIGNRLAYVFGEPERGDIVIFKYPDDESQLFVKRVIGLPGETVTVEDAKVYINGEQLDEWYLKEEWVIDDGPYTFEVPEGCYLVMGDNRNNSKDARYWINTYVEDDQLLGKAVFRYWPFNSMGKLE